MPANSAGFSALHRQELFTSHKIMPNNSGFSIIDSDGQVLGPLTLDERGECFYDQIDRALAAEGADVHQDPEVL
jgi:hypothetical protein